MYVVYRSYDLDLISLSNVYERARLKASEKDISKNSFHESRSALHKMSKDIIVTVNDGKIQGTRQASPFFPKEFYSFFGIPYAEPPVGKLRFRVRMVFATFVSHIRDTNQAKMFLYPRRIPLK